MNENMRIARREWWKWVLTGLLYLSGIWISAIVQPIAACIIGPIFGTLGVVFVLYGLWIGAQVISQAMMERRWQKVHKAAEWEYLQWFPIEIRNSRAEKMRKRLRAPGRGVKKGDSHGGGGGSE